LRHRVFYAYPDLIRARAAQQAFHPNGSQRVISVHPALFVLLRTSPDGGESLLCVHNVSDVEQSVSINLASLSFAHSGRVRDLIAGVAFPVDGSGELNLLVAPYQVLWLAAEAA